LRTDSDDEGIPGHGSDVRELRVYGRSRAAGSAPAERHAIEREQLKRLRLTTEAERSLAGCHNLRGSRHDRTENAEAAEQKPSGTRDQEEGPGRATKFMGPEAELGAGNCSRRMARNLWPRCRRR